ncbi:MAG: triose-phosphate isomerase [Deltaproteobacteria bacterium]|nr:triose-phosphate isomerase [Deltaproteobacteria bacterium]
MSSVVTRVPVFAANWKMNKLVREAPEYVERLNALLGELYSALSFEVLIAPPATHIQSVSASLQGLPIKVAAQNCGTARAGAFTGEISPAVLKELACQWVILGHSERRHIFNEEDSLIASRLRAALEEGLNAVVCVGEVLQDRKAGKTFKVIESQLALFNSAKGAFQPSLLRRVVVAYEPVWAIGTGENATPQEAQEVHAFIRNWLSEKVSPEEATAVRVVYGGSVKAENSGQIMAQKDVDGLLVGGASLDPNTFAAIIKNGLKTRLPGAPI